MNKAIIDCQRIVIKIGSSLLVDLPKADQKEGAKGQLREKWLAALAHDIAKLQAMGKDVILVSSGSIALGRVILNLPSSKKLEISQACAAVGQIELAASYRKYLGHHDIAAAQILLALEDTENRRRYLNARNTILRLLKLGAVPVINENDTVSTGEMKFGDNDRLAARVAGMCSADILFLLSDVDGLYTTNPTENPDAKFIETVDKITPEIEKMAGKPNNDIGTGGMVTKIAAAHIATKAGCHMVILNGTELNPISRYLDQEHGTWFKASATPVMAKKKWISGTLKSAGKVHIDAGAVKALTGGKSLLPAGVLKTDGEFDRGDTVDVIFDSTIIAWGITSYNHIDTKKIKGRQSSEILQILKFEGSDELIHRNDLVMK